MTDTMDTYRTVTPYLVVRDAALELSFLEQAFGGREQLCHRDSDGAVLHAEVRIGDSLVMVGQANERWKPLSASLYLWVEDVDGTYARALEAGASSESEPEDKPYGHRNAGVIDRNGVTWWIGSPARK
jgi:uncharacterized glyoxalase superfamily protein PhnB